ncbi:hypothetical protein MMC09_003945 [Bachmanniomyces sp. S44760]|nr:hypothetical protein [Bachmanniomyces sp. S44760]
MSDLADESKKWVISALERGTHVLYAAISLTLEPQAGQHGMGLVPDIEPLPFINYPLVHALIDLARPILTIVDYQQFQLLVKSRYAYFKAYDCWLRSYRRIQDHYTTCLVLEAKIVDLEESTHQDRVWGRRSFANNVKEADLAHYRKLVSENNAESKIMLQIARGHHQKRVEVTQSFSQHKMEFKERSLPKLVQFGKTYCDRFMEPEEADDSGIDMQEPMDLS